MRRERRTHEKRVPEPLGAEEKTAAHEQVYSINRNPSLSVPKRMLVAAGPRREL